MATPESVCNELARSRLFSADEAKGLLAKWRAGPGAGDDGDAFGKWLVRQGKLTDYQFGLLQRGNLKQCQVGDYILVDRIGAGRMAGVYEARSKSGQRVAIKILPPSKAKDPEGFGRFQREARIAMKLKHPNVVRTFDTGQDDKLHFLVMEYLEGETLDDMLKRRKQLPAPEALRIVHQALLGLQHLHEQDVIHRDLKPANLMLTNTAGEMTVKILDVGLGKALFDEGDGAGGVELTAQGDILGEPDYMAPEQARNASAADIRADIYSIGCILYHLLTGSVPFPGKNAIEKLMKHAKEKPKPLSEAAPSAPPSVQTLLDTLMAKELSLRPATPAWAAKAVLDAINEPARPAPKVAAAAPAAVPVAVAAPAIARPVPAVPVMAAPIAAAPTAPAPAPLPEMSFASQPETELSNPEPPEPPESFISKYGAVLAISVGAIVLIAGVASVFLRNH